MSTKRFGFSLLELTISVLIFSLMLGVVAPAAMAQAKRAKEDLLRQRLRIYREATFRFYRDTGVFPATLGDIAAAPGSVSSGLNESGTATTFDAADYRGPYVPTVDLDPLSNAAFTYRTASPNVGGVVSSAAGTDAGGVSYANY